MQQLACDSMVKLHDTQSNPIIEKDTLLCVSVQVPVAQKCCQPYDVSVFPDACKIFKHCTLVDSQMLYEIILMCGIFYKDIDTYMSCLLSGK